MVLPRERKPGNLAEPLTTILRGDLYQLAGRWQRLELRKPTKLAKDQQQLLRAELKRDVDLERRLHRSHRPQPLRRAGPARHLGRRPGDRPGLSASRSRRPAEQPKGVAGQPQHRPDPRRRGPLQSRSADRRRQALHHAWHPAGRAAAGGAARRRLQHRLARPARHRRTGPRGRIGWACGSAPSCRCRRTARKRCRPKRCNRT